MTQFITLVNFINIYVSDVLRRSLRCLQMAPVLWTRLAISPCMSHDPAHMPLIFLPWVVFLLLISKVLVHRDLSLSLITAVLRHDSMTQMLLKSMDVPGNVPVEIKVNVIVILTTCGCLEALATASPLSL